MASAPPGLRGALGDLQLRQGQRRAAPRSGKSARGCHFKLKKERAGEREGARGGLLGACPDCGAVPVCARPGGAPDPHHAAPRRAPGDTAGLALRPAAGLGAGAYALREARPEQRARVGARFGSEVPPRSRGEYALGPPQRAAGLRALRPHAVPPSRAPHPGPRTCTRTPGTAHAGRPSPAQPLRALRIAPRPDAAPRVHTRGSPRCLHASPAFARHAHP